MNLEPFLKELIEFTFEFTLKQILEHAPAVTKKILARAKQTRTKELSIHRADLINRKTEIESVKAALEDVRHLRILYFAGEGGVGKTRILEETKKLIEESNILLHLRWGGILDLYHTDLHSISKIQEAIVQGLDPEAGFFQEFRKADERFNRLLSEGLTGQALEVEHKNLSDLFLNEYQKFAENNRSVIAFDTLESMAHESDWVEKICRPEKMPIAFYELLILQMTKLENTVILMAGRPQPELQSALAQANNHHPGQMETIQLNGLTRADSRQFLDLLLKKAPPSLEQLTEKADLLWQATRGLPVQLALAIELATQGEYVAQSQVGFEENTELWGQRLIEELFSYENSNKRVFFFLALARKGLTADLLHYLEPEWSLEDCREKLERLSLTSLVKIRPDCNETFLHDALYELFDAYFTKKPNLKPWYERLAEYYRAEKNTLGLNNHQRGQTEINLLYYELCYSSRQAFESVYLPLREKAITGHELEMDLQFRDELLRHVTHSSNNLSMAEIDCDGIIRWVRRFVIQADFEQAILVAEMILGLGPGQYSALVSDPGVCQVRLVPDQENHARQILASAGLLFWGQLLTYYSEALVYSGGSESKISAITKQATNLLGVIPYTSDHPLNWLRVRMMGRANHDLGYLMRLNGHYGRALQAYQDALQEFSKTDFFDEQAETLNNLAFAFALLGASRRAKKIIDNALELRQRLGQKYPLALGHNTRGLILGLQGQYEMGRRECQLALGIFKELETPRGIGLACNALGYILRKQGENWKWGQISSPQAIQCFQQSADYLKRAAEIFPEKVVDRKQVDEPIRSWEAYNEQGSLYREWGRLLEEQKDLDTAHTFYRKAEKFQFTALEVAQQNEMRFHEADTWDDLAKVWYDQGNDEKAKQLLDRAISLVPEEFMLASETRKGDAPAQGEAYWLILGKAYWQKGQWALESISKVGLSENSAKGIAQQVITNLTLAAYYFECYWPETSMYNYRLNSMANEVLNLGLPVRETKSIIKDVAIKYNIDITRFLHLIDHSFPRTKQRGGSHGQL